MGCMVSSQKEEKESPLEYDSGRLNYRIPSRTYDSGELRLLPAKAGGGKVPEMTSMFGKAGIAGLEKAVGVLDTLGSSISSFNPGKGFVTGVTFRGNKISILAFEVANTVAKGATLMKSLSKENIQLLKEEVLHSEGIRQLVSTGTQELLRIAAADKRNELDVFSAEVIRFGNLCKDPVWHNLGRYFERLSSDLTPPEQLKDDAETTMQQLMNLAQTTSELYHELHSLDRFEHDYRQKLLEEESLPAGREVLMILQSELKRQRKLVKILKQKSLWSRSLEEVVEKLVDIVVFLHNEIVEAFETNGTNIVDNGSVQNPRLGASGLALHYANIINQIDNIVSRPLTLPPNMRDTLYQGLPIGVKAALRSRLQLFDDKEEYTVAHIKGEMQKTLRWIVPLAENTIRAHQGFGWVGEWANIGSDVYKKPSLHQSLTRIQTLFHADKEETEKYILELVVWLHHLVVQVKSRGYGFKAAKPNRMSSQRGTSSLERKKQKSSHVNDDNKHGNSLQISDQERELLENVNSKIMVLGRSKSEEFARRGKMNGKIGSKVCRSYTTSPTREFSEAFYLHPGRTYVLDVLDGLGTLPSGSSLYP